MSGARIGDQAKRRVGVSCDHDPFELHALVVVGAHFNAPRELPDARTGADVVTVLRPLAILST